MDVHVDPPCSRAHHVVNILPGTREDVAEGLPAKLAGGCRLLEMGVIPPAVWIQPTDCLGASSSSWTPHWAPPGHQSFFYNGFQCDFPGKVPFPLQSLTCPQLSTEKLSSRAFTHHWLTACIRAWSVVTPTKDMSLTVQLNHDFKCLHVSMFCGLPFPSI